MSGTGRTQDAQTPVIPNFWDPQERVIRPDVKGLKRLRFLTTTDFPPFSFIDRDKRLTGFHVDLARAICAELDLLPVCQIQGIPFSEIEGALRSGNGEAALAGQAITAQSRSNLTFSRPYFRLPARFIAQSDSGLKEPVVLALEGKTLGIVADAAHAAFAKANFHDVILRQFATQDAALTALEAGEVAAVFSDALALSFWIQRKGKTACCDFIGGPYLDETYFGRGLAIAMPPNQPELQEGFDFALRSINDKGIFAELYLRYFPISLF